MTAIGEYEKLLPDLSDEQLRPYWDYLKRHEFRLQKCQQCGHIRFPVLPICTDCLSDRTEWVELSGKGTVWSWVLFHQLYNPAWAADVPYNVVYVLLDEGVGLITNLVNVNNDDIFIDMPVEIYFDDVTDEVTLPKFQPIRSPGGGG